jgi:small subunit ribosomal protein S20
MAKEAAPAKKEKRPSALKRDAQSERRRVANKTFRSQVRTATRSFDDLLKKGDPEASKKGLDAIYSLMDKGVKRGVYKINKASRTKARLAARLAR